MMTTRDTSAAAVERLAVEAEAKADMYSVQHGIGARNARDTAATLRALLARAERAEAERDRLLKELRNIEADCDAEYPPSHGALKQGIRAALKETRHD